MGFAIGGAAVMSLSDSPTVTVWFFPAWVLVLAALSGWAYGQSGVRGRTEEQRRVMPVVLLLAIGFGLLWGVFIAFSGEPPWLAVLPFASMATGFGAGLAAWRLRHRAQPG